MSDTLLEEALKQRLDTSILISNNNSSSGCISKGFQYEIDGDRSVFVKTNSTFNCSVMFQGEFESLKDIHATNTIRCPRPIDVIHNYDSKQSSAIVMEYLNITKLLGNSAKKLGTNLASLHDYNNKVMRYNEKASRWIGKKIPSVKVVDSSVSTKSESDEDESSSYSKHCLKLREMVISTKSTSKESEFTDRFVPEPETEEKSEFGFRVATSCGSIPQTNDWCKDWVSFYARNRLDKAIREILSDHGDRELMEEWSKLQLKVDKFFTEDFPSNESKIIGDSKIIPALLHGDLWSGNVAQIEDSEGIEVPVIYDPSSFYGHSEYDFGIARMFGGFPKQFEEAYFAVMPKKKGFEKRNKLYQLFHHLNHWSHFGQGYRPSSLGLIKNLNTLV